MPSDLSVRDQLRLPPGPVGWRIGKERPLWSGEWAIGALLSASLRETELCRPTPGYVVEAPKQRLAAAGSL